MSFTITVAGDFPGDADGSQHAAFAAQVQTLFGTLTPEQLGHFTMTVSQDISLVPQAAVQPAVPVVESPAPSGTASAIPGA